MNSKGLLSYYEQEMCVAVLYAIDWLFIKPWPFIAGTPVRVLNMLHVNKMGQTNTILFQKRLIYNHYN